METRDKTIEIIASLTPFRPDTITETDNLQELGFDSLQMVELIIALEDAFSITFEDSELDPDHFSTVRNIINLVGGYIKLEV